MPLLEIASKKLGTDITMVSPAGSIDTDTYLVFKDKLEPLIKAKPKVLVLDMGKVEYLSSMGVSALLDIKKAVEREGGRLIVVNLQSQVQKVLEIIKALPKEGVFTSRKELDDYLIKIQRNEIDNKKKF